MGSKKNRKRYRLMTVFLVVALLAGSMATTSNPALADDSGATALRGVDFVDAHNGWAVGASGTILHTTDGGITWVQQDWTFAGNIYADLFGVKFVDVNNGWAVGCIPSSGTQIGVIIHTSDAGEHWEIQATWEDFELGAVDFVDLNNGWTVSHYGFGGANKEIILHTSEGGANWNYQKDGRWGYPLHDVDFVGLNNGWVVGSEGVIWHTSDGGLTWELQPNPLSYVGGPMLYGVDFVDHNNGWAVSGFGEVIHTSDGGGNWNLQFDDTFPIQSVDFIDTNNGWAVGGKILHTSDGGNAWGFQRNPADYLRDVIFINSEIGWAVGEIYVGGYGKATILHTVDGGETWTIQISPYGPTPPEEEGCFIATAAYGTSTAKELDILRAFRDEVLLQNSLGSLFVDFYYDVSPPLANFISHHEPLRMLLRDFWVDPVVRIVEASEHLWRN